jgi:hypothetical protein
MGITIFWISGPKSRSVNNSSQRSDFGLLGLILDSVFIECRNMCQKLKSRSVLEYMNAVFILPRLYWPMLRHEGKSGNDLIMKFCSFSAGKN